MSLNKTLTGAVTNTAGGTVTRFSGIRVNNNNTNDRATLNLISGPNVTLIPTDDSNNDELEITISSEYTGTDSVVRLNAVSGNLGTVDLGNLKCGGAFSIVGATGNWEIEGFTSTPAKPAGFWFCFASSNTAVNGTIRNEDSTALAANRIRNTGSQDIVGTNLQGIVFYAASDGLVGGVPRWRFISADGNTDSRIIEIYYKDIGDSTVTITPPSEATWFEIECQGGGAGGGGADSDSVKESCAGGGGGAGAWFRHRRLITTGNITGQIGNGGTAGEAATGGNGGAGGITNYSYDGTGHNAPGGAGGAGTVSGPNSDSQVSFSQGGLGGVAGNALESADGGDGFPGIMFSVSANNNSACGGCGGASYMGGGGKGGISNADGLSMAGFSGKAPGSGGGGGARTSTGAASAGVAGAAGKAGCMKVTFWSGPVPADATIS